MKNKKNLKKDHPVIKNNDIFGCKIDLVPKSALKEKHKTVYFIRGCLCFTVILGILKDIMKNIHMMQIEDIFKIFEQKLEV